MREFPGAVKDHQRGAAERGRTAKRVARAMKNNGLKISAMAATMRKQADVNAKRQVRTLSSVWLLVCCWLCPLLVPLTVVRGSLAGSRRDPDCY